ncbi:hypothetical protein VaNZ11_001835 [Volvox africanus]|uniref:Metallo-beta-lactamase domain-containing protein n=1 Tax=Volvox africanus TaxID=51714 RepID=A0ABQ5RQK0_9CHLO|nr:hypothetical protein VaNZ11_001835 [Volvox africanus]
MSIEVLPLGAGQDVGRSCCIVRMAGRTVMFDCGAHFGFRDARRFPAFELLSRAGRFTEMIDAVVITHFHTDHLGALPYFTEVNADRPGERLPYNEQHVRECLRRVTAVDLHQVVAVAPGLSFTFHYAGHVLGAAMVHMTAGHLTAFYTGDFNSSPDRHLGPAEPRLPPGGPSGAAFRRPDVLISEATYAATLRDSKRARERDLLSAVVETVSAGGKVLIPTFAMGRAQELLMLITDCWERNGLQVPIYFSSAMASRALVYYQLLLNWTNANVRRTIFGAAGPAGDGGGGDGQPPVDSRRCSYYRPYCSAGDDGTEGIGGGRGDEGGSGEEVPYDGRFKEYDDSDDDDDEEEYGNIEAYEEGFNEEGNGGASGGGGGGGGGSADSDMKGYHDKRRQWRRRQAMLPSDISPNGLARTAAAAAATNTTAGDGGVGDRLVNHSVGANAGSAGGGVANSLAEGVGVFSEADVYGMFRTRPWDRSLLHAHGAALLFASPGSITSGVSLEAFRAWSADPKNLLVLAGYQVRGTLGARLEAMQSQGQNQHQYRGGGGGGGGGGASAATVDVPNVQGAATGGGGGGSSRVEVRCRIKMLAFSAHADLRGLLGLVRRCAPRAVVLVHGQREPMEFLRGRIENHLGIECHAPPTGTTVTISPRRAVPLGVRPQLMSTAVCAAGLLAAQSMRMAHGAAVSAPPSIFATSALGEYRVAEGPANSGATGVVREGDDGGNRVACVPEYTTDGDLNDPWVNIHRLRPQPMTALPLSGIVVARVVQDGSQLQPGIPPAAPAAAAAPAAPLSQPQVVVATTAGNAATQLTLTDSSTAAKVLLQAHQAKQQHVTPVTVYDITYGCNYAVRFPTPHRTGPASTAKDDLRPDAATTSAAFARAHAVVAAAVGGYAATRRLQLDVSTMTLRFGTFQAQLTVVSDPDPRFMSTAPRQEAPMSFSGGQVGGEERRQGRALDGGSGVRGGDDASVGGDGGDGGVWGHNNGDDCPHQLQLRICCRWSASEEAIASRCLQALRGEFGVVDPNRRR